MKLYKCLKRGSIGSNNMGWGNMPKKKVEKMKREELKAQSLLDQIVRQISQSTKQIFACYIPGQINSKLFVFKDEKTENDILNLVKSLKNDLKNHLSKLQNLDTNSLLLIANLFAEIKDYTLAKKIYNIILTNEPENVFCWSNILTICLEQGDINNALKAYLYLPPYFLQNSIKEQLDPHLNGYRTLNVSLSSSLPSKIHEIGKRLFESSISDDDFTNELRILLSDETFYEALEKFNNQDFDGAFILFSNIVSSYPDSHILNFLIAETAMHGKHYLIAEEHYKKAINIRNNIPEYWFALASCFYAQYKNEQALKALKTAITLDPSYNPSWELAGEMIKTIETSGEYNYFIEHLQMFPDPSNISAFSSKLIANKKFQLAFDILQFAIRHFPEDTSLLEQLGLVYERMGKFEDAINVYVQLLKSGTSINKYLRKITSILSVLHDDKRLVKILKEISAFLPWDETGIWKRIGELLMRAKDYLGASEAFRKVLSLRDEDPRLLFNLALTYQELHLLKKAEETYRKVLKLNPNDHAALNNLGNVLKEQRRYDEAIEAYQKAIEIDPDKAISWANLGILYEELKLRNEAKKCYRKAKEIALKNKDFKSAAKFESWENSL